MIKKPTYNDFKVKFDEGLSIRDLAKYYDCSITPIKRWQKEYNLKRDLKSACKLRCKLKPQTNPGRKDMPKAQRFGKDNHMYKGGFIRNDGYKIISVDGEQRLEHRYIWEQHHKKPIPKGHQIHHLDFNKLNNHISNLQCLSNKEHQKLHNQHRCNVTGRFE